MSRVKIGVIGTGNMGKNHLRVLSSMSEFELVGLYDADHERATALAAQYEITAFATAEDLYRSVEAVSIAVPSFLHHDYTVAAAKAGCHVMVEKPIALKVEDAEAMIAVCKERGVVLMVGHVERYNPAIMELAHILENEKVLALDFRRMSPRDTRISDADVVQDLMIHDLDVLNALVDEPVVDLSSHGAVVYSGKLDYVQALVRYPSGIVASVTASRMTETKIRKAEIHTEHAFVVVDYLNRTIEISRKTNFSMDVGYEHTYKQENVVERVFVPMHEPLRMEFAHFCDCVVSGKTPKTSGEMGLKALRLCQEIVEKATH